MLITCHKFPVLFFFLASSFLLPSPFSQQRPSWSYADPCQTPIQKLLHFPQPAFYPQNHGSTSSLGGTYSSLLKINNRQLMCHVPNLRLGGMCGVIVTSPFDVVKTRLQSSLFREKQVSVRVVGGGPAGAVVVQRSAGGLLWNFVETG